MDKKDNWDKFKICFDVILAFFTFLFITFIGTRIETNLRESELKVKYVEIAADILGSESNLETPIALKKWALDILKENSPQPLPSEAEEALLMEGLANKLNDEFFRRLFENGMTPYSKPMNQL